MKIEDGQASDILAQVGALVKSDRGPFGRLKVRKMVLSGSSMSSGTLINYLPAHMVYRTPDMQHIYDGFMPTSAGQTIMEIDVPLIQLPTMLELENNVPHRQDSDEPGKQYRLYEIAGIGHVDSRDNVRLKPNPCTKELSTIPLQAFFSRRPVSPVALGRSRHRPAARAARATRSRREQRRLADGARRAWQSHRRHPQRLCRRAGREVRGAEHSCHAADPESGRVDREERG